MTRFYLQFLFASFIPVPPAVVVITDFRQFFNLFEISVSVVRYIKFFHNAIFPFFFIAYFLSLIFFACFYCYFYRLFLSLVFLAFFFNFQSKPTAITQTSAAGSLFWILLAFQAYAGEERWGGRGYPYVVLFSSVLHNSDI